MYVYLLHIDLELPLGLHAGGDGDSGEAMITRGVQLGVRHPVAPSWQCKSIAGPGC